MRTALILTLLLGVGCAAREAPYRFRSPVLGGVAVRDVAGPARTGIEVDRARKARVARKNAPAPVRVPVKHATAPRTAPHAHPVDPGETCGAPECYVSQPVGLLAEVGRETTETPHEFALRMGKDMGVTLRPELAHVSSGEELVVKAREQNALATDGQPLVGDLVVFSDGWLIGVVAGTTPAGAVEFLYVQRGRVVRGYVTPGQRDVQRDAEGRILNTFIRGYQPGDGRDTEHLAGKAFTGFIHLDRIAA